jgi:hypothetical protein
MKLLRTLHIFISYYACNAGIKCKGVIGQIMYYKLLHRCSCRHDALVKEACSGESKE